MRLRRRLTRNEFFALPADRANYYAEQSDDVFALMVERPDGKGEPIEEKGEDTSGLKSAFEKEKLTVRELKEQAVAVRAAAKAGDDAAIIAQRLKRLGDIEDRMAACGAEGQKALDSLKAEYEPRLTVADRRLEDSENRNDQVVFDYELDKAIRAAHGYPELLAGKVSKLVKIVRDPNFGPHGRRIVGIDINGEIRVGADGVPVGVSQVIEEMKSFDPSLAVAFEPSRNGGAPH